MSVCLRFKEGFCLYSLENFCNLGRLQLLSLYCNAYPESNNWTKWKAREAVFCSPFMHVEAFDGQNLISRDNL